MDVEQIDVGSAEFFKHFSDGSADLTRTNTRLPQLVGDVEIFPLLTHERLTDDFVGIETTVEFSAVNMVLALPDWVADSRNLVFFVAVDGNDFVVGRVVDAWLFTTGNIPGTDTYFMEFLAALRFHVPMILLWFGSLLGLVGCEGYCSPDVMRKSVTS